MQPLTALRPSSLPHQLFDNFDEDESGTLTRYEFITGMLDELTVVLPDLPKLRHLNLNHCKLLDSGASSLAAVLPALPRLESLQMNVAGLKGGKGTLLLAQARGLNVH